MNPPLSHGIGPGGELADCWDYHDDSRCPVASVPGSANGAKVILLRTWEAALAGLRDPALRDLRAIDPDCALSGISREHPDGLLRRAGPATAIRTALNPQFSTNAVAPWRPGIRELAAARARALRQADGRTDLVTGFCEPLARDVACLTAGLEPGEWQRLLSISARANAVVLAPGDHVGVDEGRQELYRWCAPIIARHRAARERSRRAGQHPDPALISLAVAVMDDHGMPEDETVRAAATIIGGFPSIGPVLTTLAFEFLRRPDVMDQCRADPGLLPATVWEGLRHTAHFTFGLPGMATRTIDLGRFTIPAGANVLPVIRAAHRDPSHTPERDPGVFDLGRRRRAILTFGRGVHACLGQALTLIILEETLRALAGLRPGLRLAVDPDLVIWQPGLMPTPARIPVLTAAAAEMAACVTSHDQPGRTAAELIP